MSSLVNQDSETSYILDLEGLNYLEIAEKLISFFNETKTNQKKIERLYLFCRTARSAYDFVGMQTKYRVSILVEILKLRLAIRLIKSSEITIVAVSEELCEGYFAELVIASDVHICLSNQIIMSFPELLNEIFPLGGTFESLHRKNSRLIDEWKLDHLKVETRDSSSIYRPDLFIHCSGSILEIAARLNSLNLPKKEPSKTVDRQIAFLKSVISSPMDLENSLRFNQQDRWNFQREILKKFSDPIQSSRNLCLAAANIISRKYFFPNSDGSKGGFSRFSSPPVVYLDVNNALPNKTVLARLLRFNFRCVICCSDMKKLLRSLELSIAGIEKLGDKTLREKWGELVYWSTRTIFPEENSIRFNIDHSIDLQFVGKQVHISYIEYGDKNLICEINSGQESFHDHLNKLGFRLVSTPKEIDVIVYTRLFLLHAIRSVISFEDTEKLFTLLKESGWKFAASQSNWEFYLRHKSRLEEVAVEGPVWTELQEINEIASWKQFKDTLTRKNTAKTKNFPEDLTKDLISMTYKSFENLWKFYDFDCTDKGLLELIMRSVGVPQAKESLLLEWLDKPRRHI